MKYSLLLLFLVFSEIATAQVETITISGVGDANSKSVRLDKSIGQSVNPDKFYKLAITGVNSAHTSLKIIAKSKKLVTPIPDALKTILPGITESLKINKDKLDETLPKAKELAKAIKVRLDSIKSKSEFLHAKSLYIPDTVLANTIGQEIEQLYASVNAGESLGNKVILDIQYLNALKKVVEKVVGNQASLNGELVELYANLLAIHLDFSKNDYQMYFDYITRSKKAKNVVVSKIFTGSKDLVELSIILIDTYTKDTLANETRTLYTKGGSSVELSFSTGFFYSTAFSDIPYYLKARPNESLAVLTDRRIESDISIGALGHLFYKFTPFLRVGPSIGLAVSPFDGKSRYLIGGSVLVGKEKMLGFTAGCAWAKVKELSAAVSTDSDGTLYVPKGTSVAPTFDTIKNGWFFGLTYNLTATRN